MLYGCPDIDRAIRFRNDPTYPIRLHSMTQTYTGRSLQGHHLSFRGENRRAWCFAMPLCSPRTRRQNDDLRVQRPLRGPYADNLLALTNKRPNETSFNNMYTTGHGRMCIG